MTTSAMREFIDALKDPAIICDPRDARVLHANSRALHLLGFSPEGIIDYHIGDTSLAEAGEGVRMAALDLFSRAFFEDVRFMWTVRSMTGNESKVHVTLHPVDCEGQRRVVALGRELHLSDEQHAFDLLRTADTAEQAGFGAVDHLGIERLERLAELAFLACGTMHDVNNYLTIILGHCEMIASRSDRDPDIRRWVRDMIDAAHTAARLQHQVLGLARKMPAGAERISLNEVLERQGSILKMAASKEISFALELCEEDCVVEFDPARLSEVLLNLVNNARDAMPRGGGLTIGVALSECKGHVHLWVNDTGTGIPEDMRERVFQPFVTTKPLGKGTGLGLTMVRRIVEEHGGRVGISSAAGEGTRVEILLPRISDAI